MQKAIIIRYCEIHLKGKNQGYFLRMLFNNIKNALKGIECNVLELHSRFIVDGYNENDSEIILNKLRKVSGIHTISEAIVTKNDFTEIRDIAILLMKDACGKFRVTANRADKTFPMTSMQLASEIGGILLDNNNKLTVDVKNPATTLFIDIREDKKTFIYTNVEKCMSGMPVGSAGKGLLLVSGGIDSPVAGYMTIKRGMKLDLIHFHSYPYTSEAAKEKVIELSKKLAEYNSGINLYIFSFTKIQEEIHKKCPEDYMITIMRRFMMRISERFALSKGDQAIITGEDLGQVASQTVESITTSNNVIKELPVFRPLIMFDKNEIIEIARKIDTFETSILPYEDCCTVFLPKFPVIKPSMKTILKAEENLDIEGLIEDAFKSIEKIEL